MCRANGSLLRLGLSLLTGGIAAILVKDVLALRKVPRLAPTPPQAEDEMVSVLVPARDESRRIPRLLEGLSKQSAAAVEVIILDDNSSDGTAEVVAAYNGRIPALFQVSGAPLPSGWAGKCWACWQAAQFAAAPWLLFLDADAFPAPALVSTLLGYARRKDLDLLSLGLLPLSDMETFWERVLLPPFMGLIQVVFPLHQVNDPRSPLALANGQCLLIKRSVYFAVGGHKSVRQSVLEDVALAQQVKGAGYRIAVVDGPELLRVRMYTGWQEIAEGLRKNAWAGYAAGGRRSAWAGTRQIQLALSPFMLMSAGIRRRWRGDRRRPDLLVWGALLWAMTTGYSAYLLRRLTNLHPAWALLYPFGTIMYFVLAGWAWLSLRFGRGVSWKGRTYGGSSSTPTRRAQPASQEP